MGGEGSRGGPEPCQCLGLLFHLCALHAWVGLAHGTMDPLIHAPDAAASGVPDASGYLMVSLEGSCTLVA